jgi:hypothetical protein
MRNAMCKSKLQAAVFAVVLAIGSPLLPAWASVLADFEEAKLTASDGAAEDHFGNSVAISGDTAVIGAVGDDDNGSFSGSAYVFRYDGSDWVEEAKLTASDGAASDQSGGSVAVSDDAAVVGAPGDDDNGTDSGSAYVFQLIPPVPPVEIDIRPWSKHNFIYPLSRLLIPVTLLGSDDFDVANADVTTLAFGPDEALPAFDLTHPLVYWLAHWDVNGDGKKDLLSYYRTQETGIALGQTEACLTGETLGGTPFEGCDAITTLGGCGRGYELAFLVPPLVWLRHRRRGCSA